MESKERGRYTLHVPLDASGVKDFKPDRGVKVVAYGRRGAAHEVRVRLDDKGKGNATFTFHEPPGTLRIVVGPETASAEDLKGLQTISADLPARRWAGKQEVILDPIPISAYYWWWWFWWCRNFKITGRVVCADGRVVPGATVCAYDVDAFWWWWSKDLVGCATTDINGAFEIDFTRCCGWWPWWWWERRPWLLEPSLIDRIAGVLRQDPALARLPLPGPTPSPRVFEDLLGRRPSARPPQRPVREVAPAIRVGSGGAIDPASLDALRTRLLDVLPLAPELERLRLWPWWPWWPWWDCDADIIFSVSQVCGGQNNVIVNEGIWQTRWDIPTNLNVTLVANDQACCVFQCPNPADCPEGDCLLPSDLCLDNLGAIGGNLGRPVANPNLIGLLSPGEGATLNYGADRPYAGAMSLYGKFGDLSAADYYELLVYYAGTATPTTPLPPPPAVIPYAPLPIPAFAGFIRQVFDPGPPAKWVPVSFPVTQISDGATNHHVIETTAHYEANHGAQLWDVTTFPLLAIVDTLNNLANGTYFLQIRSWTRPGYAGNLTNPQILQVCGEKDGTANWWAVTIDNQVITNGPIPQSDPYGLPCGPGTVHVCTVQPETAILQVAIVHQDGSVTVVDACANVCIVATDTLRIDFAAYDPDAYLAYYTLALTYGASLIIDLLALAGAALSPSPIPPPWSPAAAQVGPDYRSALAAGATAPWWAGGAIRLEVSAAAAFPETCAYQLQLYAHKRTIGSCDHGFWNQYNLSELSFTVVNPCPPPVLMAAPAAAAAAQGGAR